jgi:Domain of unknown function (DUF1707)
VSTPDTATRMRASDEERQHVVDRLHRALAEGRLDLHEADERTAAAYAVRYRDEFPALLADLPAEAGEAGPHDSAPTWQALAADLLWRIRTFLLGPGEPAPTATHRRQAALIVGVTFAWVLAWMAIGVLTAR